jgi:hypothetical protein
VWAVVAVRVENLVWGIGLRRGTALLSLHSPRRGHVAGCGLGCWLNDSKAWLQELFNIFLFYFIALL